MKSSNAAAVATALGLFVGACGAQPSGDPPSGVQQTVLVKCSPTRPGPTAPPFAFEAIYVTKAGRFMHFLLPMTEGKPVTLMSTMFFGMVTQVDETFKLEYRTSVSPGVSSSSIRPELNPQSNTVTFTRKEFKDGSMRFVSTTKKDYDEQCYEADLADEVNRRLIRQLQSYALSFASEFGDRKLFRR